MTLPTPFPEVNDLLRRLRIEVQAILGDEFTGMYLYGSLALGDFDPQKSDIDFVVVTRGEISETILQELQAMHARIAAESSKWAMELEGSYIPQQALRRYDPETAFHPHIDRGSGRLAVEQHHSDWVIQRYSLREHGVALAGPNIKILVDPISEREVCQAVLDLMWWWELQLQDTSRVAESGYQAYAILSMCRVLYTFEHGTIVSKPEAARWAQRTLDGRWAPLIERALTWGPGAAMDRLEDTLEFIRYTLECSRQFALRRKMGE